MKPTQKQLVKSWILDHGFIIPARMGGRIYKKAMFGSSLSRRCRNMRADGVLESYKVPKTRFTAFRLA